MNIKTAAKRIVDASKLVTIGELKCSLELIFAEEYTDSKCLEAVLELINEGSIKKGIIKMNCSSFKPSMEFVKMVLLSNDVNIVEII